MFILILFCLFVGVNEDNSMEYEGSVYLEEYEVYSNMMLVLKVIEILDELDWRDFGRR